ncbi:MAG: ribonuclease P protein component [Gammaproteobacteria bacterium]
MQGSRPTEPAEDATHAGHCFTRAQRILRTGEFERTLRGGRRLHHRLCALHHRVNTCGHARLGIAVGRRVSPSAVKRNTIKRIVRECFRQVSSELPPLDIIVVARAPAATVTRSTLRAEIRAAFEQLSTRVAHRDGAQQPPGSS